MGLDISAFSGIEKVDCVFDEDGDAIHPVTRAPIDYDVRVYANPDFPGRAAGVEDRACYVGKDSCGLSTGYGSYNAWRNELAKLAGYPETRQVNYGIAEMRYDAGAWLATSGPFWELINFSDCEGTIGPVVSAKLAKDFAEFEDRAKAVGGHFYDRYQEWREAFDMAANSGLVRFH